MTALVNLNGLGTATSHHCPVITPSIVPAIRHKTTFTIGPPSTVIRCAFQRSGGRQYASPPNGHMRISSADPPTFRHARQCPNSCSSTMMNKQPMAIATIARPWENGSLRSASPVADRSSSMTMNSRKTTWTRTVIPANRPSVTDQVIVLSRVGRMPCQSPSGRPKRLVGSSLAASSRSRQLMPSPRGRAGRTSTGPRSSCRL